MSHTAARPRQDIDGAEGHSVSGGASLWDNLCHQYESVRASLLRLGGRIGTEDEADALLEEQERLVARIATHQAMTKIQIAQKLKVALSVMDESDDGGSPARLLLESAAEDLLR